MNLIYLLILAMIIWGVSWASAKTITNSIEFEVLMFWRFLFTFVSLIPVIIWRKDSILIHRKSLRYIFSGSVVMMIYNAVFLLGLRYGLAGAGGVFVTTLNPLINSILIGIFYNYRITLEKYIGLFIGLFGGMIILKIWEVDSNDLFKSGNLYFISAAFIWAFLSIVTQRSKDSIHPIVYSLYLYGVCTFASLLFALRYDVLKPLSFGFNFWLNIFYLSTVSTTFGTTIYFIASSRLGSGVASSFIFIVPVSAMLSSWFFLGEVPQNTTILGGLIALGAVYLLNRSSK